MDVDMDYVNSDEYAEKFRGITGDSDIDTKPLEAARRALEPNSGTDNENDFH